MRKPVWGQEQPRLLTGADCEGCEGAGTREAVRPSGQGRAAERHSSHVRQNPKRAQAIQVSGGGRSRDGRSKGKEMVFIMTFYANSSGG